MLRVEGLRAGYGTSQALAGVDLEVPDGKLVAILGRNGMGKTSLCRSIMGVRPPVVWSGSGAYGDIDLTPPPPPQGARARPRHLPPGRRGFASPHLLDHPTLP